MTRNTAGAPSTTTNGHSNAVDHTTHLALLRQFFAWIIPATLIFASLETVAFLSLRDLATGITAAVIIGFACVALVARAQVQRNQPRPAVATLCAGLIGATLLVAPVQPVFLPALTFVPLVAVVVALPFTTGNLLRRLILICWLSTMLVAILSEFAPRSLAPFWLTSVVRVSALGTAVGLTLLLVWQFSTRLTATLASVRAAEERYELAALGANDGLWDWDLQTNQMYFSPRWKAMLGYSEHVISTNPDEWFSRVHRDDRARVQAEVANHQDGLTSHFESEHRVRNAQGRYCWMLSRGVVVRNAAGKATRMAGSQTDMTQRKQIEEQLLHDAFHDGLTGLANRALLHDRLNRAFAHARRHPHYLFAVLFVDLDRFKNINDSLGHTIGDALLMGLADRFRACVRPNDTVARLGGDEFAILLDGVTDLSYASLVAQRIHTVLESPFDLHGNEVFGSVSIGIAVCTPGYEQAEELLRDADLALYRAKALGRGRSEMFKPVMHTRAVALLQIEMDLRRGIDRQEFCVYYQPIVVLKTGQISGFEALVRWKHPQRGLLAPVEFLAVAEDTGMIVPIGWMVLREACRQLRVWQAHFPEHPPLTVSVNLSANQFAHPELHAHLDAVFREIATHTEQLRLEITETVLMDDEGSSTATLNYLRQLGIQLLIDDFGTGYSSLSTLHQFPIHALKIDQSFVARMGMHGEHTEMVQTIVAMAHHLGLEVIAEGVETEAQLEYLRSIGCDYAQGYLFSPPVDAAVTQGLIAAARNESYQD